MATAEERKILGFPEEKATFLQHHTVVRDGWHNYLVDLAYWRHYYWLVYRRESGHYRHDGGIVILRSVDLKRWQEMTYIKTSECEWNPRLYVVNDRLMVYFWSENYLTDGLNTIDGGSMSPITSPVKHTTRVSFTDDGVNWSTPQVIWNDQTTFRVRQFKDEFYMTAYGFENDPHDHIHGPLDLLKSKDGLTWQKVSEITGIEDRPNDSDMYFNADGELWVIVPTWKRPKNYSLFFVSKPPYQTWERFNLNTRLNSPCFCQSGDKLYVAGRRWMTGPWITQSTAAGNAGIWVVEKGKVTPLIALPSIGDHWQPGLISTEPGKLIISYNSQHAYIDGVLSSKVPVPVSGSRPGVYDGDSDIFLAEIAVK